MNILCTVEELKKSESKGKRKEWIREKATAFKCWFSNNKDVILVLGPVFIGGAVSIIKVAGKHVNLQKAKDIKELYCYDRSLGHYWALRRELSNAEWIQIDKRKANGERLADILEDLRVLK